MSEKKANDVEFPDILSPISPPSNEPPASPPKPPGERLLILNDGSTAKGASGNETMQIVTERNNVPASTPSAESVPEASLVKGLESPWHMSLKERVRPGKSERTHFPLVPSKVALLVIDIQEYLSYPTSVQDEEDHAYFFRKALPRTLSNVEKLLEQTRQQRDGQSQGCEVIFTYLEALTQDCRDVSLDYKLSGPRLASLPNSPVSPATFLESVAPRCTDGKGDICIPKTSCSVFMSTNLHYILQNLHVEQLLVCGQLTDQCVESAVRDAADMGYFVTVIHDACAALSEASHEKGLAGMKGFSRILSTEQVLDELLNPGEILVAKSPGEILVAKSLAVEETKKADKALEPEIVEATSHVSILPAIQYAVPPCNEESATTALLHTLQFAGVQFLRFMAVDACNSIRSKAVPLRHLTKSPSWNHQVSIARVCFAGLPTYGDYMLETTGLDAQGILSIHPDLSTLRILPYAPTSALVLGNAMEQPSGTVSPLCTRGLLARVMETARQYGITFNVGAEIEFCLYKDGKPVDQSVFGNTTTLNEQQDYIDDLWKQLQQQQIEVEQIHAESAPGQVELVLEYQDSPLVMADWVVLTCETVIAVAKSHGLQAVFLPKLDASKAGNGCHLHVSFCQNGRNAFSHPNLPGEMSASAKSFMEGILRHLPALLGLTLPTNNSFRRVGPGCWTGSTVGWAMEDKEAPLRVCRNASGQWSNVEYKLCDSTANLYLALSAILSCGLDGIVQELRLRPSLGDQGDNATPLPSSLHECLALLRKDELLLHMLGRELSTAYIAVRQAESELSENLTLEEHVEVALHTC